MGVLGRVSLCLAGGLLTLATAPAQANQVPGATYTGTADTGGTISFDVSTQGGSITRFAWSGVRTECGVLSGVRRRLPIIDRGFGTLGGPFTVSATGSFPATQQAAGTLAPGGGFFGGDPCEPVGWTATTTATGAVESPDTTPPLIETRVGRRLSDGKGVRVWVYCPEEVCLAWVRGSVSIGRGARDLRLKRFEQPIAHGVHAFVDADLGDRAAQAVRRSLRQARRVTARVTLVVTDVANNRTVARFSIRLRRHN